MTANLPNPFEFSGDDTCREYVTLAIQAAGWGNSPFEIAKQHSFTDGHIAPTGRTARQPEDKRTDCLLRYRCELTLVAVEAKDYAEIQPSIDTVMPSVLQKVFKQLRRVEE